VSGTFFLWQDRYGITGEKRSREVRVHWRT